MLWRTRRDPPEPLKGQDKERGLGLQGEDCDHCVRQRDAKEVGAWRRRGNFAVRTNVVRPLLPLPLRSAIKRGTGTGTGVDINVVEDGGAHAVKPWRTPVVPRRSFEIETTPTANAHRDTSSSATHSQTQTCCHA